MIHPDDLTSPPAPGISAARPEPPVSAVPPPAMGDKGLEARTVRPYPHASAMQQERSPNAGDWGWLGWVAAWEQRGRPEELETHQYNGVALGWWWDQHAPVNPAAFTRTPDGRVTLVTKAGEPS